MGSKHFFNQRGAKVTAIDFHKGTGVLVVGFSNGIFDLFEVSAGPSASHLLCHCILNYYAGICTVLGFVYVIIVQFVVIMAQRNNLASMP